MANSSEPWAAPPRISWTARILGPLALIAVVVAFFVILSGSSDSGDGGSDEAKTERANKGDIPKTYIVEPGDSLSSIAEKYGISVKRIERLNKGIDTATLNEGQEIKLH